MSSETLELPRQLEQQLLHGAVIGVLIGFQDEGQTPLVIFPGQIGDAATPARAVMDLHGAHIGREVVLFFEHANPRCPLIMGVVSRVMDYLRNNQADEQVEVEVDGERTVVTARDQLVLQCGKASITLTRSGKILLRGTYVLNSSSGVMRINGGSIQLN